MFTLLTRAGANQELTTGAIVSLIGGKVFLDGKNVSDGLAVGSSIEVLNPAGVTVQIFDARCGCGLC